MSCNRSHLLYALATKYSTIAMCKIVPFKDSQIRIVIVFVTRKLLSNKLAAQVSQKIVIQSRTVQIIILQAA
jgi:hypothetical protein